MQMAMTNGDPVRPQLAPYKVRVEAGKTYAWCACGRSREQPFCDGSHKETGFTPTKYTAAQSGEIAFCGCKASGEKPLCDGTHRGL